MLMATYHNDEMMPQISSIVKAVPPRLLWMFTVSGTLPLNLFLETKEVFMTNVLLTSFPIQLRSRDGGFQTVSSGLASANRMMAVSRFADSGYNCGRCDKEGFRSRQHFVIILVSAVCSGNRKKMTANADVNVPGNGNGFWINARGENSE